MTLGMHSEFSQIKQCIHLDFLQRSGVSRFKHLSVWNHFISFEYLEAKIQGINGFQYKQVKAAVNGLVKKKLLRKDLTKFKSLLHSGVMFKKMLSKIYCLSI